MPLLPPVTTATLPFRSVRLICLERTGQKTDHNQAGYRMPLARQSCDPFPKGLPSPVQNIIIAFVWLVSLAYELPFFGSRPTYAPATRQGRRTAAANLSPFSHAVPLPRSL